MVKGSHMVICEAAAQSRKMWTLNMKRILEARSMARLRIKPRPSGYIPGALPLSYLALGDQVG